MSRNVLYAIIALLLVGGGAFAYQAYLAKQEKDHSLQIQMGPNGIKVDPPKN